VELEQNQAEFRKLGVGIAAISYDSEAILRDFSHRKGIHFPLLSDPDSKIIRAVGILNETVQANTPYFGIPYPGSFVLDANGVIVAKYFEDNYKERYTSAAILVHNFGALPEASKSEVAGKQLSLVASASNFAIHPQQRVALVLDVEMKPGTHVYAPGVEGYIPIEWSMKESAVASPHEVSSPKPEILYLAAIDEKVPVLQQHFQLKRDITLSADDKLKAGIDASGNFTVEGALRYQACDDRICYVPQVLPLKWTFHYEGFDRERSPAEIMHRSK
jgi:AhpC/TSA family protein/cytochrome c biogenesis DsbD-like protein